MKKKSSRPNFQILEITIETKCCFSRVFRDFNSYVCWCKTGRFFISTYFQQQIENQNCETPCGETILKTMETLSRKRGEPLLTNYSSRLSRLLWRRRRVIYKGMDDSILIWIDQKRPHQFFFALHGPFLEFMGPALTEFPPVEYIGQQRRRG